MKDSKAPRSSPKSRHLSKLRIAAIFTLVVVLAGITTVVLSKDQNRGRQRSLRQEPGRAKKYVATKEIIFDQASGKLRKPTTQETQAIVDQVSKLTNRSSEGLAVNTHPNGMKSMNLEGRFNGVVLGRDNADGTTEIRCVFTMEEAAEFLGLEEVTWPEQ